MNIAVVIDDDTGARGAFDAVVALRGNAGDDGSDCRYPIGEPRAPDFRFCCKRSMTGSVYCSSHHFACSDGLPQTTRKK